MTSRHVPHCVVVVVVVVVVPAANAPLLHAREQSHLYARPPLPHSRPCETTATAPPAPRGRTCRRRHSTRGTASRRRSRLVLRTPRTGQTSRGRTFWWDVCGICSMGLGGRRWVGRAVVLFLPSCRRPGRVFAGMLDDGVVVVVVVAAVVMLGRGRRGRDYGYWSYRPRSWGRGRRRRRGGLVCFSRIGEGVCGTGGALELGLGGSTLGACLVRTVCRRCYGGDGGGGGGGD